MIKGAIFDIDGTLLDSMPVWDEAGERYLKSIGLAAEYGLGGKMFSMTMEEGARYLKEAYRIPDSTAGIVDGINRQIEEFYLYEAELKTGAEEYLNRLEEKSVRLTAATSSDRYLVEAAFVRLGIDRCFDGIFTCSEAGAGKDEPRIYLEAASCMGTKPEETLVFEDALHAIETSAASGFITVGVYDSSSEGQQEEICRKAQMYLKAFSDFDTFWKSASAC